MNMDTGSYNCRDYYITPAAKTPAVKPDGTPHSHLQRHESWTELEHRARSPASKKPKFPLMRLPLELRQQILTYLLPYTQELGSNVNRLAEHARNFSAVKKRMKGLPLPPVKPLEPSLSRSDRGTSFSNLVWHLGNVDVFRVCRQLHDECADLMYGRAVFMLFVTFSGVTFRLRWRTRAGMTPNRTLQFFDDLPDKYRCLIRKAVVHVDHLDPYTAGVKFNVSGKGLTHGLRRQIFRLVNGLQPIVPKRDTDEDDATSNEERGMIKLTIRVSNGNAITDSINSRNKNSDSQRVSEDVEQMLEPFGHLCSVREAKIMGAVNATFASALEERMRSADSGHGQAHCCCDGGTVDSVVDEMPIRFLCYGNDIK